MDACAWKFDKNGWLGWEEISCGRRPCQQYANIKDAKIQEMGYCPYCGKRVTIEQEPSE